MTAGLKPTTIRAPGMVTGMAAATYHAGDITPEPALSSSLAVRMVEQCARVVWYAHPALNPRYQSEERGIYDLGSGAHARVLQPDEFRDMVEIVLAPDYRTKAAQVARDMAREAGRYPLLEHQVGDIEDMAAEIDGHPLARLLMADGIAERSHFWIDRATGVWCKARPDWFVARDLCTPEIQRLCGWAEPGSFLLNYKTHGGATSPHAFARHVGEMGYCQRGAWEMLGLQATTGEMPDHYILLVQETDPPYLVTAYELQRNDLEYGLSRNREALAEFARCLSAGTDKSCWPGYRSAEQPGYDTLIPLELPAWKRMQLEDDRLRFLARSQARKSTAKNIGAKSAEITRYYAP